MKKKRLGRVCINHTYVVDLNNKDMIREAVDCLYEDLMNAVKYDELQDWIHVVADPTATEDDIPEFLCGEG